MPRRGRRTRSRVAALAALLLAAGCGSFAEQLPAAETTDRTSAQVATVQPGDRLTLVADADPVASAVSTSRALYAAAGVAVVAQDGDRAGLLLGGSAAVGLGVPLLLADGGGRGGPMGAELHRLGVRTVLAVGAAGALLSADGGPDVVAVPADRDAVAAATRLRFAATQPVDDGAEPAALARLDPRKPAALRPADDHGGSTRPSASGSGARRLPEVARPQPLKGVVVLATGGPESLAGIATARAAGARVQLTGGQTDPRASGDVVETLAAESTQAVLALGAAFADDRDLDWQLTTARTGTQLPGGGQLVFPGHFLVAMYGTPGSAALGVLGEQDLPASIQRARDLAAPYESLVDPTVVPAFEIIATIASSAAGPDGNYSAETDPDVLRPWVEAAQKAGLYVVLDLQPGRADFLTQARAYSSLLEQPNVGLALDPEWRLGPGQQPLQQIGSVGVDEVNSVISWLADLTREHRLPQKLLVVHQFRAGMIAGRERLDTSRAELAVTIHADGQGSQGDKQATWARLHEALPTGPLHWGWKNFYDEDAPMLTPQQTIAQVAPTPDLISYQ